MLLDKIWLCSVIALGIVCMTWDWPARVRSVLAVAVSIGGLSVAACVISFTIAAHSILFAVIVYPSRAERNGYRF